MSLANCNQCGRLMIRQYSSYCEQCQKVQDGYFMEMRKFLQTNPNSTMLDIHQHTGIPIAKLLELRNENFVPFRR